MIVNDELGNLVRLGDYIEVYDLKNIDSQDLQFCGINKDKTFMPTVADTNELDSSKYKIVKKDMFVFSGMQTGRDVCIRLALFDKTDSILVSPAYTTFVVKDKTVILPEYLFIQFNRFGMDRYGWFLSDGSVRSNLDWNVFCDIQIPLPDINIQQELVYTYNGLKALAEQNEALIKPLTDACRAYISECKKKYDEAELGKVINQRREKYSGTQSLPIRGVSNDGFIPPKQKDADLSKYNVFYKDDFVFNPARMELNSIALNTDLDKGICSSLYEVFSVDSSAVLPEYLNLFIKRSEFARQCEYIGFGSAREYCRVNNISEIKFPLPPPEVQQAIVNLYNCAEEAKKIASEAREKMKTLCPALVQKAING
jgi:type I restriction enzyme S subunit